MNILNRPEVNIITVEDPVEYRLPGSTRFRRTRKARLTFAAALRSILRSDPDIVLIGEVRDHETAQIAVESALTGHLVLTTLHTNDAPSAITRLIEMGIEPFLVGSALDCAGPTLVSQAVSEVQGGISAFRGGAQLSWDQPGAGSGGPEDLPSGWLLGVLTDRLQGQGGPARGPADHRAH